MHRIKKSVLLLGLCLGTTLQTYGQTLNESRLFPISKGFIAGINADRVNFREYPSLQADCLGQVMIEDSKKIRVLGKQGDWYKVIYQQAEGWIYGEYVDVSSEEILPYVKTTGEEVLEYSKQFIGTPYIWGGEDLENGVDCSGFTQGVYKAFNVDISRVSYLQAKDGTFVQKDQLRVGDLVFFATGEDKNQISHVGIYAGNAQFIHADSTHGVMLSQLNSPYYTRNYVKSVRVL